MSINACGDCVACCRRLSIDGDLWEGGEKPRNTLCEFSCSGCSIYETRPAPCRSFKCVWLRMKETRPDFPDHLRPDQVGVMVWTKAPENNEGQILFDEIAEGSFNILEPTPEQGELLAAIVRLASRQAIPITLLLRTYDWNMKKIDVQIEQTT